MAGLSDISANQIYEMAIHLICSECLKSPNSDINLAMLDTSSDSSEDEEDLLYIRLLKQVQVFLRNLSLSSFI